ncbi:MAG: WecB/TagA/CpsF family glycosyltransferase [Alphaproteobacteria bacterium]
MIENTWSHVLGVNVSVGTLASTHGQIRTWIERDEKHFVTITGAHGIIESQRDPKLLAIHNRAGMVTADGMPLVWMSKAQGHRAADRVYGPDLMDYVLRQTRDGRVRHYLYGGLPDALDALEGALSRDYPGVQVVGKYAPPFRKVGELEADDVIEQINAARPNIIWVGLSTPKQEYWMANHLHRLNANVLIGVGAAFDFLAGRKAQAPRFVQRSGFEWLYRMTTEPKRLASRYLDIVPRFMMLSGLQLSGLRRWPVPDRVAARQAGK